MKKAVKRIAAIAMAFTLFGTGTTLSNAIKPKANNTFVANAMSYCPEHNGKYTRAWIDSIDRIVMYLPTTILMYRATVIHSETRCAVCDKVLSSYSIKLSEEYYFQ